MERKPSRSVGIVSVPRRAGRVSVPVGPALDAGVASRAVDCTAGRLTPPARHCDSRKLYFVRS